MKEHGHFALKGDRSVGDDLVESAESILCKYDLRFILCFRFVAFLTTNAVFV